MMSVRQKKYSWIVTIIFLCALPSLAGCLQIGTPSLPPPTPTPITPTPTVFFPTLIPTPTFTPIPTGSPTPDLTAGLGEVLFKDDFSQDLNWTMTALAPGGVTLRNERLTLSVRQANGLYMVLSPVDPIQNAYVEVEVRPEICSENDEYGIAFRINNNFDHYRFTLTCKGEARVVGVVEGSERILIPNTRATAIFPGLFLPNRLGILLLDDTFRFFINGEEVFSDRDTGLAEGRYGLVVRARQSGQMTASFDDFIVRTLRPDVENTLAD